MLGIQGISLNWRHKAGLFLTVAATGFSLFLELSVKQTAGIAILGISFAWLFGGLSIRMFSLIAFASISIFGPYMAIAPIWGEWKSVKESVAEYDSAIAAITAAVNSVDDQVVNLAQDPNFAKLAIADQRKALATYDSEFGKADDNVISQFVEAHQRAARHGPRSATNLAVPPPPPGYVLLRSVEIPNDILQKWLRPDVTKRQVYFSDLGAKRVFDFPSAMSHLDIMREFETILRPRPVFSLVSALKSHAWHLLADIALLAVGLVGCVWNIFRNRKSRSQLNEG
ncbi:MAG TPA: hypothetical protein VNW97_03670 [Candidatus Saccharimonadales bacterium]|jgi:hypothetical protein|nr:hypothetical protein [Candidatus Saccharimonadales bacterium]